MESTAPIDTFTAKERKFLLKNKPPHYGWDKFRGLFDVMSDTDRTDLARAWTKDATHFRQPFLMWTPQARACHRLLHMGAFRAFRKLVIITHLLLAVWEWPVPDHHRITGAVEVAVCCIYVLELGLQMVIRGSQQFWTNGWLLVKSFLVPITIVDAVTTLIGISIVRWRPLRILRAFYVVENSRDLRAHFKYFLRTIPAVFGVILLVFVLIVVYTVLALQLFVNTAEEEQYFPDFYSGAMNMFHLLTTVNFPDIMLPAYAVSQWNALFFISFLMIGLYFSMNLAFSTVVFTYRTFRSNGFRVLRLKQAKSLAGVFHLLAAPDPDTGELAVSQEKFVKLLRRVYPDLNKRSLRVVLQNVDLSAMLSPVQFAETLTTCIFKRRVMLAGQSKLLRVLSCTSCFRWWRRRGTRRRAEPARIALLIDEHHGTAAGRTVPASESGSIELRDQCTQSEDELSDDDSGHKWDDDLSADEEDACYQWCSPQIRLRMRNFRAMVRAAFESSAFRLTMNMVLLFYTVSLIMEAESVAQRRWSHRWLVVDMPFTAFFLGEMVTKLFAYGCRKFSADPWRRLDLAVVVLVTVGQCLAYINGRDALVWRTAILTRLISNTMRYRRLLVLVSRLIKPFAINFVSLFVIFYSFAIVGMGLFAGKIHERVPELEGTGFALYEYYNVRFDSFPRALVVLFELMVLNNWHVIAEGFVVVTSRAHKAFFVLFYFLTVMMSVNIIIAWFLEIFSAQWAYEKNLHGLEKLIDGQSLNGADENDFEMFGQSEADRVQLRRAQFRHYLEQLESVTPESVVEWKLFQFNRAKLIQHEHVASALREQASSSRHGSIYGHEHRPR